MAPFMLHAVSSMGTVDVPHRVTARRPIIFSLRVPCALYQCTASMSEVTGMVYTAVMYRSVSAEHATVGDDVVLTWRIGSRLLWFGESDDELAKALHYIHGYFRMMCLDRTASTTDTDSS